MSDESLDPNGSSAFHSLFWRSRTEMHAGHREHSQDVKTTGNEPMSVKTSFLIGGGDLDLLHFRA